MREGGLGGGGGGDSKFFRVHLFTPYQSSEMSVDYFKFFSL